MAAALPVDWSKARALYAIGLSREEIVKRVGCPLEALHKRIQRGEWDKDRQELDAQQALSRRVQAPLMVPAKEAKSMLSEYKERFLEAGGHTVQMGMDKMREEMSQVDGSEAVSKVSAVTESLVRSGKVLFGLDAAQPSQQIQVNVLSELPAESVWGSKRVEVVANESTDLDHSDVAVD
jgi:hypothetical protein